MSSAPVFAAFAPPVRPQTPLRAAITAATRRSEPACVAPLVTAAQLDPAMQQAVAATARMLITALRAKPHGSVVEDLIQEYALSSQEGVALMCLAEALLRIPDAATRDALIRDKISDGDWAAHLGGGKSLFVNAATWGLVVTGKLTSTVSDRGLGAALARLIGRAGEPVIRRGVDMAMRMMGEQFVTGETIDEALVRARTAEARGYRYSYDMLGEAAMTADDAQRYFDAYEAAIHAIGRASAGRGVYAGPGISIKLSALHPRYVRAQAGRVMAELLPRVQTLARLARRYDIGLNIDAEESERLELSLDLMESLCFDPDLAGWNGIGFVIQAYGKRCPFVIDFIVDLAKRSDHRIMVRLVKGAYWDSEIKRAQVDGQSDFPVFTRKVHTDVSYIACATKLLAARSDVFPQFATHNAQTLATVYHLAGPDFAPGDYEFQCLHGMGEPLYDEVVGAGGLNRPCRIYAPVGTHETLLAYLVRRLLENGANSSFVNRIANPDVPIDALIADPATEIPGDLPLGQPHPSIALPAALFAARRNSAGLDLANEDTLAALSAALTESAAMRWTAAPTGGNGQGDARPVLNPGDHRDIVGEVIETDAATVPAFTRRAAEAAPGWAATPVSTRAEMLGRAADAMQADMPVLIGLIMREAGKSAANAMADVREAIDFLRYYAVEAQHLGPDARPLGPVVCISPWNFPLAIFIGQISAALVAGNPVLAKPAEETPLTAAAGAALLHKAGVPEDVLQLLPGDGRIGAALVAAKEVQGVMFTGSTEVARLIQHSLAPRLAADGVPIPLIAETGGQNAMIVDSSALAEQVVGDVIASAFDSAGQRCSALRILCLQEEIADRTLEMLQGAMHALNVGPTDRLATDIGPVISAEARTTIASHIARMGGLGNPVEQLVLTPDTAHGTFIAPAVIEIDGIEALSREVFGPVLHVVRYARDDLDALIQSINATGYGLTFGLHTRLDDAIEEVSAAIKAGNLYINRNIIGAVVGVQPFGGRGLSGTGPKAGGPLYLKRLVRDASHDPRHRGMAPRAVHIFIDWLDANGFSTEAAQARALAAQTPLGFEAELAGPVGERNLYGLHPRGNILIFPDTEAGLLQQLAMVFATGNRAFVADEAFSALRDSLPAGLHPQIVTPETVLSGALIEATGERLRATVTKLAERTGPLFPVQHTVPGGDPAAATAKLALLVEEVALSVNTTAAGGNASLMTIG